MYILTQQRTKIRYNDTMRNLKRLIKLITNPNAANFQRGFAYSLLLSLAPVAIAFFLVFRYLSLDFTVYITALEEYLPNYLIDGLKQFLANNDTSEFVSMIALVFLGINVASKSLYSYLKISNSLNKSNYPGWFLKILSYGGMLGMLLGISAVVLTFSFLPISGFWIQNLILLITIMLFYKMVSLDRGRVQDIIWGSLFTAAALWFIGTFFTWYISTFTNYQSIYGPLASLMVFLLLLLILSQIVYIGFCINVIYRDQAYEAHPNRFYLFLKSTFERVIPKRFQKEDEKTTIKSAEESISESFKEE